MAARASSELDSRPYHEPLSCSRHHRICRQIGPRFGGNDRPDAQGTCLREQRLRIKGDAALPVVQNGGYVFQVVTMDEALPFGIDEHLARANPPEQDDQNFVCEFRRLSFAVFLSDVCQRAIPLALGS